MTNTVKTIRIVDEILGYRYFANEDQTYGFLDHSWKRDSNFSEAIADISSNGVDIYRYDLGTWVAECEESENFLEAAVFDGFVSFENYDFYRHVQAAQELWIRDEITKNLETFKRALAYYSLYTRFPVLRSHEVDAIDSLDFNKFETYGDLIDAVEACLDNEPRRV